MMIIGVDYHPSFQTIAFFLEETGECGEQELKHSDGQAEKFYRDLKQRGIRVRVGMEATGYSRWFERLLAELGFEIWIGDPAEIKAKRGKKQKFDREDARLLLRLLRENNFPQIWVPGPENRDLRQLLWHRHRLVQMRTRIMNQLHALAMNEGYRWKKKLFSEQGRAQLEKLTLAPWASRRRQELLELLDRMNPTIEELTAAVAPCGDSSLFLSDGSCLQQIIWLTLRKEFLIISIRINTQNRLALTFPSRRICFLRSLDRLHLIFIFKNPLTLLHSETIYFPTLCGGSGYDGDDGVEVYSRVG